MPDPKYAHVARAVFDTPWFIRETEGAVIASIVRGRMAGERFDEAEIAARVQAARAQQGPRAGSQVAGPVAIVPVYGVIMQRASLMTEMSGGTSVEFIRAALDETLRDKDIAAVVLEFDSPGGEVYGIEELATWMREQRGTKPMVAVVNTLCCSAAYYLAAQCDEIVATPSSLTGSVGVFLEHVEFSKANELEGVTPTIVRQPATKHDINGDEPLTDAALAHLQMIVDDYYGQFVAAVAKGRSVAVSAVRDGYGQGREITAARAKSAGLVDRIDTFENTIRRLSSGRGRAAMAPAAEADIAVLGSGLPFTERLSLVTAGAQALTEHAREHAEMRANAGRSISGETREQLATTASTFRGLADDLAAIATPADVDPEPPDATASTTPWTKAAANRLALVRAEYQFD